MYGKVMSISDEMMWRYYELLTDVRMEQIAAMKADAASGKAHPMALKKELARSIVADFHSAEAAAKAADDWAKQFQKGGVPEEVEEVDVPFTEVVARSEVEFHEVVIEGVHRIKLDRLLFKIKLADSVGDASRKIKQRAVRVDGELTTGPVIYWNPGEPRTVRVGRKIKKVTLTLFRAP